MGSAAPDQVSQWVRVHGPYLMGVVRSFFSSPDEAEDAFQEIWVVVLRKLDRAPPAPAVRAWLYSIALKVCLGRARTSTRRKGLLERWATDVPKAEAPSSTPDIEGYFRNRELHRRIAELPELQRRTLILRVVDEKTTEESAQVLNRATGTVKASLHRALHKLRDLLKADGEEPSGGGRWD